MGRLSLGELGLSLHPGQREVLAHPARFKIVAAGRRWGKSHLAIIDAVLTILRSPQPVDVWVVSPSHVEGEAIWNKALAMLGDVRHDAFVRSRNPRGLLVSRVYSTRGYRHLIFFNGARIYFKSGQNPDNLRGGGDRLAYIVFDEAAYLRDSVWKVLRFALIDKLGRAIFISTPNQENPRNWFYDLFLIGQPTVRLTCSECRGDGCPACNGEGVVETPNPNHNELYRSWQFSSFDNPTVSREEIERIVQEEGFTHADIQREIYAQFFESEGAVFTLEMIQNCERGEYMPGRPGEVYVMGVDFGQVRDFTAVAVINTRTAHLDHLERFQGSWDVQLDRVATIYREYNAPLTYVDASQVSGSIIEEELRARGVVNIVGVKINGDVKTRLVESLRVAIERADLTFPPDRTLRTELLGYTAKRLPSGHIRYGAPRHGYDDCVDALALAWDAYRHYRQREPIFIKPAILGLPD